MNTTDISNQVILGNCLEILKTLPNNSIDLICTDPPYHKVKADWWDRQWENPKKYLEWLDKIAEQWFRLLKPNGSLYCFASPRMAARVEVLLGERFNVLNRIRWVKQAGWHNKTDKEELRGYLSNWEEIVFCEHYGADNIAKGEAGYAAKCDELRGFVFEPVQQYMESERLKAKLTYRQINVAIDRPVAGGGMATHYFSHPSKVNKCTWQLPTEEHYIKLQQAFPGYFTRPYEELKQQYEELRRPFSVSAEVPYTDVWTFPTVNAYPGKHPCEKPQELLKHIIQASSREGATMLDCFAGSGSTLLAAKQLNRQFVGIEIDPHWHSLASQRVGQFVSSPTLEQRVEWLETQMKVVQKKQRKLETESNYLQLSLNLGI